MLEFVSDLIKLVFIFCSLLQFKWILKTQRGHRKWMKEWRKLLQVVFLTICMMYLYILKYSGCIYIYMTLTSIKFKFTNSHHASKLFFSILKFIVEFSQLLRRSNWNSFRRQWKIHCLANPTRYVDVLRVGLLDPYVILKRYWRHCNLVWWTI